MKIFSILLFCVFASGCVSTVERAQEHERQGVYAVHDSMDVGRFDVAKRYSDDLVKTVPPPKKRIVIKAVYKTPNP